MHAWVHNLPHPHRPPLPYSLAYHLLLPATWVEIDWGIWRACHRQRKSSTTFGWFWLPMSFQFHRLSFWNSIVTLTTFWALNDNDIDRIIKFRSFKLGYIYKRYLQVLIILANRLPYIFCVTNRFMHVSGPVQPDFWLTIWTNISIIF